MMESVCASGFLTYLIPNSFLRPSFINEWLLSYIGQRCGSCKNERGRCLAKYLRLKFAGCTPFLPA